MMIDGLKSLLKGDCAKFMFGGDEKLEAAIKELETGKYKDIKFFEFWDSRVVNYSENKKYKEYYDREKKNGNVTPTTAALTYKREAVLLLNYFNQAPLPDKKAILAHEYLHIFYDKSDAKLIEMFEKDFGIQFYDLVMKKEFPSDLLNQWQEKGCPKEFPKP